MAKLVYEISGTVTGLQSAAQAAGGILNSLKQTADNLKIQLFQAKDVDTLNGIGGALQIVTGKIADYTNAAIKGSQAFKDQSAQAAIDTLNSKITVLTGNTQLFGQSIANSQSQIRAYQAAIDALLKNGFDPLDTRVQGFKNNIDRLTASINVQKEASKSIADPFVRFVSTGSLIQDAENRVRNLGDALRSATSEREIVKYNIRLVESQKELARLRSIGIQTADSNKKLTDSIRGATGGYNSFGVEFGRVIQDLPYAANNFGAIGNNITRLAEIFPGYIAGLKATVVAQGGVATTANLAKVGLAGLFTGFGGISLAISAAVSFFTIFQQRQQAVAREAKEKAAEMGESYEELSKAIKTLSQSNLTGALNSTEEVSKLQQLYSASQDLNIPLKDRKRLVDELQSQYPKTFGNLSDEAILAGRAASGYEQLNKQLVAKAILQANTENLAKALKPLALIEQSALQTQKRIAELQNIIANPFKFGLTGVENARKELEKLNSVADIGATIGKKNSDALKRQIDNILQSGNSLLKEFGADILVTDKTKNGDSILERQISLLQQLQDIIKKGRTSVDASGLEGYALEVKNINDFYRDLNVQLDRFDSKVKRQRDAGKISGATATNLLGQSALGRSGFSAGQAKELSDARIKEEKRVADEITRINNEFGVKAAESKAKELAAIQARYDAEVVKAKGNAEILAAIDNGRIAAVQQVNDKYAAIQADLENKIIGIQEQAFATLTGKEEEQTERIRKEWESRRAALNGYYADLIKLTQVGGLLGVGTPTGLNFAGIASGLLKQGQAGANSNINAASENAVKNFLNKDFVNSIKSLSGSFINDIQSGFSKIGDAVTTNESIKQRISQLDEYKKKLSQNPLDNADKIKSVTDEIAQLQAQSFATSFKSVFSDISKTFAASINQVAFAVISKSLSKRLDDGLNGLDTKLRGKLEIAIAGLSFAGSAISGATSRTSALGQGIGGALSGAAAGIGGAVAIGAATGTALGPAGTIAGAAIGGLVGLVGGILGANKAQKELAEQQLKEQQQQTDLLKATLAYTTSVIGRMSADGIVTGFDIGATGEIIAKTQVSGQNLDLIIARVRRQR